MKDLSPRPSFSQAENHEKRRTSQCSEANACIEVLAVAYLMHRRELPCLLYFAYELLDSGFGKGHFNT